LRPAHLYNYFFGVLGPNGPLPLHMTEYAKQRSHLSNDRSLVAFLDMFHHRLLSLFYRAHSSADPVTQHDRPESDRFATYVGSLMGLGLPSLRDRDTLPDNTKLYYAGLFAPHTKNAAGLCALLEDYFEVKARVEEFVGEWVTLPAAQSWRLGQAAKRSSPLMGRLASSALVGTRVWLRQHRFRIALGPLRHDQFQSLLPGTPGFVRVTALVRSYIGDELKWDMRLTVAEEAIRPARLGSGAQLGRTSWLLAQGKRTRQREDLIVDPTQAYDRNLSPSRKA
jgi:type VI secretion system protein ImpH